MVSETRHLQNKMREIACHARPRIKTTPFSDDLHPLDALQAAQLAVLALLALAATAQPASALPASGRRLSGVPSSFKNWAGCEAPAYCQPATGPNLVTPEAAAAASAAAGPAVAAAAAAGPGLTVLWGSSGELWDPAGRLMDWSYAGYKQGNEPLPTPPVTINYKTFQKAGMSDTQALLAALAWAQKLPYDRECCVACLWGVYGLGAEEMEV